jgi:hypothetical protein
MRAAPQGLRAGRDQLSTEAEPSPARPSLRSLRVPSPPRGLWQAEQQSHRTLRGRSRHPAISPNHREETQDEYRRQHKPSLEYALEQGQADRAETTAEAG